MPEEAEGAGKGTGQSTAKEVGTIMIIYVVHQGSYSDRGIVGLFTSKETAEELAAMLGEADAEEWEVDALEPDAEAAIQAKCEGMKYFRCRIDIPSGEIGFIYDEREGRLASLTEYDNGYGHYLYGYLWARDRDHAQKILVEARQAHLRERENP